MFAFYLYLLSIQVTSQPVVSVDEERFLYGQILILLGLAIHVLLTMSSQRLDYT
jgi:hypothetical protein